MATKPIARKLSAIQRSRRLLTVRSSRREFHITRVARTTSMVVKQLKVVRDSQPLVNSSGSLARRARVPLMSNPATRSTAARR